MLGRLLSSAISSSPTSRSALGGSDSEDAHTCSLLYPDYSYQQVADSCDGHIDQDTLRDVRVIVAQDGGSSEPKVYVYDTNPIALGSTAAAGANSHSTTNSPVPTPPTSGLARRRRGPASSNPHAPAGSEDEVRILTECMFGSSVLAYKGPSTKVHILPSMPHAQPPPPPPPVTPTTSQPSTAPSSRRGSLGNPRSQSMLQSPLSPTSSKPFLQSQQQPQQHNQQPSVSQKQKERKSVLVTRTFSVLQPTSVNSSIATSHHSNNPSGSSIHVSFKTPNARDSTLVTPASSVGSNPEFPFPKMTPTKGQQSNTPPAGVMKIPKQPKSISYAVALVITLPNSAPQLTPAQVQTKRLHTDLQDLPEEDFRTHRTSLDEPSDSLVDDRMDLITKHWDVITRALSEIQDVLSRRIQNALGKRVQLSPPQAFAGRRKTTLDAGALMTDETVKSEIERLRWRVMAGMRIPRVLTGQGRWGSWREEAKWAGTAFGSRDRNL